MDVLLRYLNLPGNSFYENFINCLRDDNGLINYYRFDLFALIVSFEPVESIMISKKIESI